MSTPRNVCHRCRTKWKVKAKSPRRDCPKCGCENIGPTDPAPSMLPKLIVLAALAVGGAYAAGILTDEDLERAQQQVEGAVDDVRREVEAQTGTGTAHDEAQTGAGAAGSEASPNGETRR